jgi:hypothetical protein
MDSRSVGDSKVIWELNRHQHFVLLGKAYWYTGDERYAATFVDQLMWWMDANPPQMGVNWTSSLEAALRAIAWIWALYFFAGSKHLTSSVFKRALQFLFLHGRHIERYLSTYHSPNTHLTGEALGLVYLGSMLPELRTARRWRQRGIDIFVGQVDRQVGRDGVYFEQSTYYQRYTADFLIHLCILGDRNGLEIPRPIRAALQRVLDHLMYIARPDGSTPLIGDDDGGRLLPLDTRARDDFRATLASGAVLFGHPEYRFAAGETTEETLWLHGVEGLHRFEAIQPAAPASASRAFPVGGYLVMRDGWLRNAAYMLIDCGPHGVLNCGHAHADALGFDLSVGGRAMLVDPGTYTYADAGDSGLRDSFRSSPSHNTLVIDGQSSSVPDGPFSWKHVAPVRLERWLSVDRFDFFQGSHAGYARFTKPGNHTRAVLFLKTDYWIVSDRFSSDSPHQIQLRFQCAPEVMLHLTETGARAAAVGSGSPRISLGIATLAECGQFGVDEGWVSREYGRREKAPVCTYSMRSSGGDTHLVTLLVPDVGQEAAIDFVRVQTAQGELLSFRHAPYCDLIGFGGGEGIRADRVNVDCAWCWIRLSESGELIEFILLHARRLEFDNEEVHLSEEPVAYVAGRRRGGRFDVRVGAPAIDHIECPSASLR